MKEMMISSIILSIIAIVLLIYLLTKTKDCKCPDKNEKKEGLLLCDNMGNAIYKDVDYSPYVYNYPNTEFGF